MKILIYLLLIYLVFGVTYIFYIAIMALKDKWDSLPLSIKVIAAPWIVVGVLLDVLLSS